MLIIRDEQWAAFEEGARDDQRAQLLATIKATWPERWAALGDAAAEARVDGALARAGGHSVGDPRFAGRFAHLAFRLDDEAFDQRPWAAAILGWDASEEQRLSALERRAEQEEAP